MLHVLHEGKPSLVADRTPGEAQVYSLQLNQVLLPTIVDRRRAVAREVAAFDDAMGVPATEVRNQYVGLLGVIGLAALMLALCRATSMYALPDGESDTENAVRIVAVLAIAVLLLAISSGLCTLIGYWVTAKIRAYNRIFPFFAFACLLGGGWALQAATARIGRGWLRNVVITLVGAYALFDVLVRPPFALRANDIADYDRARAYFAGVEQQLGVDAAVFQLPAVWYPEHPPVNGMGDYEEFKPFLFTKSLRFSYGGGHDRNGYRWSKFVENLPAKDMIAQTHAMGFAAILIDGTAYATDESRKSATDALAKLLPDPPTVSQDGRWWLFPLQGCCGGLVAQIEPDQVPKIFAYAIDGGPLSFAAGGAGILYSGGGWQDPESWGTWTTDTRARLRMRIEPAPDGALALMLDTQMMLGPKLPTRTLHIECNGRRILDVVYTAATATQSLRLDIPAGLVGADGLLELDFTTTPQASPLSAGVNDDPRPLGVGMIAFSITRAGRSP
jgi:phosphoglycerol transferase